jgi:hypothetical protein
MPSYPYNVTWTLQGEEGYWNEAQDCSNGAPPNADDAVDLNGGTIIYDALGAVPSDANVGSLSETGALDVEAPLYIDHSSDATVNVLTGSSLAARGLSR